MPSLRIETSSGVAHWVPLITDHPLMIAPLLASKTDVIDSAMRTEKGLGLVLKLSSLKDKGKQPLRCIAATCGLGSMAL